MNLSDLKFAGMINEIVLLMGQNTAQAGMTKLELDALMEQKILEYDGEPAFKGYNGYKHATCISVNNEIVHGVPNGYIFKAGDVVTIDCGVRYKGVNVDAARTITIGTNNEPHETSHNICAAGIKVVRDGCRLLEISRACEKAAREAGVRIFHQFTGHGIGEKLHMLPSIPHTRYMAQNLDYRLKAGQIICIEPIITYGLTLDPIKSSDGWTELSADGALTAHWEHTVLVTCDEGAIIC